MAAPSDNETWLIEAGDEVIEKKSMSGMEGLSAGERLIYCLWVADYSMRNGGDLMAGADLYPPFYAEAAQLSDALGLWFTADTFALPKDEFQRHYFDRFERICDEVRSS